MTGPVEWILLLQGKDLASKAKRDFLENTRDVRTSLAISHGKKLIRQRLDALGGELQSLWNDESRSLDARRDLLFRWWDDCAERFVVDVEGAPAEAASTLDEARWEAAHKARARIEAFIRHHAPKDSARGYSPERLRQLNATRVSSEPFEPYARGARRLRAGPTGHD